MGRKQLIPKQKSMDLVYNKPLREECKIITKK